MAIDHLMFALKRQRLLEMALALGAVELRPGQLLEGLVRICYPNNDSVERRHNFFGYEALGCEVAFIAAATAPPGWTPAVDEHGYQYDPTRTTEPEYPVMLCVGPGGKEDMMWLVPEETDGD